MAILVVKWRYGVDIRKYGTHQVGASNVFRSFSKKLGVMVGLYDLVKGVMMVAIAQLLGMGIGYQVAVGLAVVIGHNWPVFLRFNAGRGVATTVGVSFYLLPSGYRDLFFVPFFTLLIGSSPLPLLAAIAHNAINHVGLQKTASSNPG
jgi:acyl-phosphate glycerol 3-phosphate acyltransferase